MVPFSYGLFSFRNHCYEADSESEDGEFAEQIREQTSRIQREIELERRLKTRQSARANGNQMQFNEQNQPTVSTLPRYRGSASHMNLPAISSGDHHAFQAYSASTPDVTSLYTAQQASNLIQTQLEEDKFAMKRLHDERVVR